MQENYVLGLGDLSSPDIDFCSLFILDQSKEQSWLSWLVGWLASWLAQLASWLAQLSRREALGSMFSDFNVCFDFLLIHVAIALNTRKMEH